MKAVEGEDGVEGGRDESDGAVSREEGKMKDVRGGVEIKESDVGGSEGIDLYMCYRCVCLCVCVYLYSVSRPQSEGAVLSENGQRAGEHGAQHPRQRYHPKTHVLTHPGLQVVHNAPETQQHHVSVTQPHSRFLPLERAGSDCRGSIMNDKQRHRLQVTCLHELQQTAER